MVVGARWTGRSISETSILCANMPCRCQRSEENDQDYSLRWQTTVSQTTRDNRDM